MTDEEQTPSADPSPSPKDDPQELSDQPSTEQEPQPERDPNRSELFHHTEPDVWEWWSKASILLFVITALALIVVLLKLGKASLIAYSSFVPLMGFVALPLVFWGLWRSMTRPPVMRRTRTIAFLLLLGVCYVAYHPIVPVPVTTADWRSTHSYRLPFEGSWYTMAGGDELKTNYYATAPAVRWAYAFTRLKDGKKFKGEGSEAEDYYCFGQPILAPVDGKVVSLIRDQKDMKPGEQDQRNWLGNHVVLFVARDEYLVLSHLKQNSINVEVDQKVRAGQQIGACGNSGFSPEPHLTVHLQNGPKFPYNMGLPLYFDHIEIDGKAIERAMPKGQTSTEAMDGQKVKSTQPQTTASR